MCVLLFVSFSDDCAEGFRPATCNVPPRSIVSQRSQTRRCSLISCETLFGSIFITRTLEILLHSALEALGRHYLFSWQSPHLHLNFERLVSKTSRTPITRLSQAPVGRAGRGDVWTMLPPERDDGRTRCRPPCHYPYPPLIFRPPSLRGLRFACCASMEMLMSTDTDDLHANVPTVDFVLKMFWPSKRRWSLNRD